MTRSIGHEPSVPRLSPVCASQGGAAERCHEDGENPKSRTVNTHMATEDRDKVNPWLKSFQPCTIGLQVHIERDRAYTFFTLY